MRSAPVEIAPCKTSKPANNKAPSGVGKLLQNMQFTLTMENQLMDAVLNPNQKPRAAAKAWL